jgi:hypothetical protein
MDDIENSFKALLGRQPSEKEIGSLYRVKNALNIRDNDALWLVLMALESYDTLYSKYPALIAGQVDDVIEKQRDLIVQIIDAESKRALGTLSAAVAKTSQTVASKVAHTARWQAWGWVSIGLATFAALCMTVGFILGSGNVPFWAKHQTLKGPFETIASILMKAPVGWIIPAIATAVIAVTICSNTQQPIGRSMLFSLLLLMVFSSYCVYLMI